MLYTGVDIVEVARIERAVQRWGQRFLRRVYTPAELAAYAARIPSLAARWAAKEATGKLLGVGLRGIGGANGDALPFTDIEVLGDARGKPVLVLHGVALQRAHALGLQEFSLSLSHTREHAIAFLVALRPHATDDTR